MSTGYQALTEKEKQTLRLLVSGYDAKSMARHLGLSVHTVNERLRDARRKMATSSSREAARLLRDVEGQTPELLGDKDLGDVPASGPPQVLPQPDRGNGKSRPTGWIVGGFAMTLTLALLAYAAMSGSADTATVSQPPAAATAPAEGPAATPARQWLAQVDLFDWTGSYDATSLQFKSHNTAKVWADASEQARRPLGAVVSRQFVSEEWVPTVPAGERLVRFNTTFANRPQATEIIPLVLEDGVWKVAGYVID
ncbi:MAG: DUF4019 domain-containing protein [Novosphingobium sp.]